MGIPPSLATALLLCLIAALSSVSATTTTFQNEFGPFNDSYYKILAVEKPATISNGALQITSDSASPDFNLLSQSGRILYRKPFKLWPNQKGQKITSFESSFIVNIYRFNNVPGEGMAFVVAPDLNVPRNSHGQYLGLTNSTTDGKTSNKILAVELDTFKQEFDPDNNHIGLNINGVVSNKTVSLTPLGFELCPANKANFFVIWVIYDGFQKVIEVYITQKWATVLPTTPDRPSSPVLRSKLDLRDVVSQFSYFGFSASTGNGTQLNCVVKWNLSVFYDDNNGLTTAVAVSVAAAALVVATLTGAGLWYICKNKRTMRTRSNLVWKLKRLPGTAREFKFKELKKATGNFDERNKLGEGAYGVVYRGWIPKEELQVAVKWFLRENINGEDDFLAELTIIN